MDVQRADGQEDRYGARGGEAPNPFPGGADGIPCRWIDQGARREGRATRAPQAHRLLPHGAHRSRAADHRATPEARAFRSGKGCLLRCADQSAGAEHAPAPSLRCGGPARRPLKVSSTAAAHLRIELLRPEHDRGGFSCGVESLDHYLKTQASQDIRRKAIAGDRLGQGLGGILLALVLLKAYQSADSVGSTMVVVDAIDEPAAAFYVAHGFTRLAGGQRLVMGMRGIEALVREKGMEPK